MSFSREFSSSDSARKFIVRHGYLPVNPTSRLFYNKDSRGWAILRNNSRETCWFLEYSLDTPNESE